jgi:hypothetical protein
MPIRPTKMETRNEKKGKQQKSQQWPVSRKVYSEQLHGNRGWLELLADNTK